jgi:hypothetical protein
MLKHIVMFRRKAEVTQDLGLEQLLFDRMVALGAQIPTVSGWRMSRNELLRPPVTWDYVLESEVADADGLTAYLTHPLHQALIKDLKPYFDWAAVDYTF